MQVTHIMLHFLVVPLKIKKETGEMNFNNTFGLTQHISTTIISTRNLYFKTC